MSASAAVRPEPDSFSIPAKIRKLRVLIIDDSRFMRAIIKNALVAYGITRTIEAEDGVNGLKLLRDNALDLILVNYEMPYLDGSEFTRMVRKGVDIPEQEIPIIMISGFTDQKRIMTAVNSGISDYLAKPFSPEALYRRIRVTIQHPLPFIRTENYIGPCRRMMVKAPPAGLERREYPPGPSHAVQSDGAETPPRQDLTRAVAKLLERLTAGGAAARTPKAAKNDP